jgi:hypothetical protein
VTSITLAQTLLWHILHYVVQHTHTWTGYFFLVSIWQHLVDSVYKLCSLSSPPPQKKITREQISWSHRPRNVPIFGYDFIRKQQFHSTNWIEVVPACWNNMFALSKSNGAESFFRSQQVLSQEIPRIIWNRRFVTAFTKAYHLSVSWARSVQSIPPHATW